MMKDFTKHLIPEEWRSNFELEDIEGGEKEYRMVLQEKEGKVPKELEGEAIVLNGYKDPIEIIDFPLQGKLMYITFLRRRWKKKGENKSYYNRYEFHRPGMKTTNGFGDFLKGLSRQERREFFYAFPNIRHIREEDFSLVSRCTEWIRGYWSTRKTS